MPPFGSTAPRVPAGWSLHSPEDPRQREIHYLAGEGSTLPDGSGPDALEVFNFNTFNTAAFNHGCSPVAYQAMAVTAGARSQVRSATTRHELRSWIVSRVFP